MDGQREEDERTEADFQKAMAFQRLRLGFKLSVATITLFAIASAADYAFLYFMCPASIVYVLSIHERTSGWRLLGFPDTSTVIWLCAILLNLSPIGLAIFGVINGAVVTFLIPLGLWSLYTYVENESIKELDKKFGLDLKSARLSALSGVLVLAVAYSYGLYAQSSSFFPYPMSAFRASILAAPLLMLSCLLIVRRLEPTCKPDAR
jgi:hypothetical protein